MRARVEFQIRYAPVDLFTMFGWDTAACEKLTGIPVYLDAEFFRVDCSAK